MNNSSFSKKLTYKSILAGWLLQKLKPDMYCYIIYQCLKQCLVILLIGQITAIFSDGTNVVGHSENLVGIWHYCACRGWLSVGEAG